jgi:hypothetical protein
MNLRVISLSVVIVIFATACDRQKPLFELVPSDSSGVVFNNVIKESDTLNVLDVSNVYNGGGVGIGDFNQDGLQDIYFSGNKVANQLYINKGAFKFEEVAVKAGVTGEGKWCRGVSVVDINNDGKQDIYISATLDTNANKRANILYVNQGNDANGIPLFKDMAADYGLADTSYSTMANFFDYDKDGDLDMFLVVNEIKDPHIPNVYHPKNQLPEYYSSSKLYQNNWDANLKHPVFIDVTSKAGMIRDGFGHSVVVTDINKDGWKDIYVTNDYLPNDYIWINNHDGTFTDKLDTYFKHSSVNSMGTDMGDINNDGLMDFITLDMNPKDNYRKKMMMNPNSYQTFQNNDLYGYNYQYVRNTLQINQGPRVLQNDSIGAPIFSEIAFLSGIAETDWSWTPLLMDADNDGHRDLFVTNGFPKDVTDHDFIMYRNKAYSFVTKTEMLQQIPEVKLHNYIFKNNADLSFSDQSEKWGFTQASFSNGAVYADLDNDGDLDLVINNINDIASIYQNKQRELAPEKSNFLAINLKGDANNLNGIGAELSIYYKGEQQVAEQSPFRGYLSSVQNTLHFGLGNNQAVDSIKVVWPNGLVQVLGKTKASQSITLDIKNAKQASTTPAMMFASNSLFKEVTSSVGIKYIHTQTDFVDFNIQKLLPHKFSEYNPAIAVGDINGDGIDDMVVGGSSNQSAQLFLQDKQNRFTQKALLAGINNNKPNSDQGILLLDVDTDNDLDILITSGGFEQKSKDSAYLDQLFLNDGKGNFALDKNALPLNTTSKLCIRGADYDKDGDIDLFIGGRVDPWNYPKPVSCFIYRNDTKNGKVKYTDITKQVAASLESVGLVCDALFTDFNNDGWQDLIVVGEWMNIQFLENQKGQFKNISANTGIQNQIGWWNTIQSGDFDKDGDMDYIVGNLGMNSFYRATDTYPVAIYAKDFDNNDSYDAFPALYLPTSHTDTIKKLYPAQTREDIVKQMISMRAKYQNFRSFAVSPIDQMFTPEQLKGAQILKANYFGSSYLKNNGNGQFELSPLPKQAQYSALNGILVDDYDADGNLDVFINGNDYGTEVSVGRYDALNGLVLKGDGKGGFKPLSIVESGIFIPGNGKALVSLKSASGAQLVAASQNKGPLKIFTLKRQGRWIPIASNEVSANIEYTNGQKARSEFYYGSSFMSQSTRGVYRNDLIKSITIMDNKGNKRVVQ